MILSGTGIEYFDHQGPDAKETRIYCDVKQFE